MTVKVALTHKTRYSYDKSVEIAPHFIRLKPASHSKTKIDAYSLAVKPMQHFVHWQQDPFGNHTARVTFPDKANKLDIDVDLIAAIDPINPFDFFTEPYAEHYPFTYPDALLSELTPYLTITESGPLLSAWVKPFTQYKGRTIDFLVECNKTLNQALHYILRHEPGVQSCEDTLTLKSGSCRDMAWLLCQALRHLGFATRFASGYLIQLAPDIEPEEGPTLEEDVADLHAWTEVFVPGAGWIGLDPTSGQLTTESHIPLCCTPTPGNAAPLEGAVGVCNATMEHEFILTRLDDKRPHNPFSDQEWQAIDSIGKQIDSELEKHDVKLTMGGEPTFVSNEDFQSSQWHFTALAEDKTQLSIKLLKQLGPAYAQEGLYHYGLGKHYPSEDAPRWAFSCIWRKDGQPVWKNDALLADPQTPCRFTITNAKQFTKSLAQFLNLSPSLVQPAFEADNADIERGFILPLLYSTKTKSWLSCKWNQTKSPIILLNSQLPMGLRLPLDTLPEHKERDEHLYPERDPGAMNTALSDHAYFVALAEQRQSQTTSKPAKRGLVSTALCVELRQGTITVYMPPLTLVEHYLELIALIETAAAKHKIKVLIEGYLPPKDTRIEHFSITPDPGVIECNIHPMRSWQQLNENISTLYEQARKTKLSAEKYTIDGRTIGSGGGNHFVIGGATTYESPFLRRPDLLQSMITFWQHHPSLSYMFSSEYIGPTCQAPRIDEARHDSLYELEIAFKQIPKDGQISPWLIDRLLRHLLVDVTGNTHRTEFCIDKLYSPDTPSGRLGLLELRGFEMPPHPQLYLLQALLLRAAISHFWQHPFKKRFIRWKTALHDQFMLPHYLEQDFAQVISHLNEAGYGFKSHWFKPFLDFRFPIYGTYQLDGMQVELRNALEPWLILGEEVSRGGTSRAVDATTQRLQIKVSGFNPERHIISCNHQQVPLQPTDIAGTYIAGVRYKAWQSPFSLHPNLPASTPLVFDIIDKRFNRAIGGCTYHNTSHNGRAYEEFPVNHDEARARFKAHFDPHGHSAGNIHFTTNEPHPEFPFTLDLRFGD